MLEKAISQLTQFHTSKAGIASFVNQVVSEVEEGTYNPLQLKIFLKAIQKSCEEIENRTSSLSLTEAEKYGEKSFQFMGATVEKCELGTKYNFSTCGDHIWTSLEKEIKTLTEEKKKRETFLKTISKPMTVADEASGGELIDLLPPIKSSTSGIKITIK